MSGNPKVFVDIVNELINADLEILPFEEVREMLITNFFDYLSSETIEQVQKWAENKIEVIVLAELDKGKLGTNFGNIIQGSLEKMYEAKEFTGKFDEKGHPLTHTYKRAQNRGNFVKGETTKGISQYQFFKQNGYRAKTLSILGSGLNIYSNMVDLVDFAKGKNINSGIMAVLSQTLKASPLLGTLMNICLQVFQTEVNKFFEDWKKEDEENFLKHKTLGVIELDKQVGIYNQRKLNSGAVYALEPISYEVMEGLVTGKIKNIDTLIKYKQKYPAKFIDAIINGKYFRTSEVQMLYKQVVVEGENILFIDSFYTNK